MMSMAYIYIMKYDLEGRPLVQREIYISLIRESLPNQVIISHKCFIFSPGFKIQGEEQISESKEVPCYSHWIIFQNIFYLSQRETLSLFPLTQIVYSDCWNLNTDLYFSFPSHAHLPHHLFSVIPTDSNDFRRLFPVDGRLKGLISDLESLVHYIAHSLLL